MTNDKQTIADQAQEIARLRAKVGMLKGKVNETAGVLFELLDDQASQALIESFDEILASEPDVIAVVDVAIPRYALTEVSNEKYFIENLIFGRTVQNGVVNGTVIVVGEKP